MHHLTTVLLCWLSIALTISACAWYNDCKCHDDATNQPNDEITKKACMIYEFGKGYYLAGDDPTHDKQCHSDTAEYGIANCGWNRACKAWGNYHQACTNKFGHADDKDGDIAPLGYIEMYNLSEWTSPYTTSAGFADH